MLHDEIRGVLGSLSQDTESSGIVTLSLLLQTSVRTTTAS